MQTSTLYIARYKSQFILYTGENISNTFHISHFVPCILCALRKSSWTGWSRERITFANTQISTVLPCIWSLHCHMVFSFSFIHHLWFSCLGKATVKISPGKLNGFASRMEVPNKVLPTYWKLDFRASSQCEDQTVPNGRSLHEGNATSEIASDIEGAY